MGKRSPLKPNSLVRTYKHTLGRPNFTTNIKCRGMKWPKIYMYEAHITVYAAYIHTDMYIGISSDCSCIQIAISDMYVLFIYSLMRP